MHYVRHLENRAATEAFTLCLFLSSISRSQLRLLQSMRPWETAPLPHLPGPTVTANLTFPTLLPRCFHSFPSRRPQGSAPKEEARSRKATRGTPPSPNRAAPGCTQAWHRSRARHLSRASRQAQGARPWHARARRCQSAKGRDSWSQAY